MAIDFMVMPMSRYIVGDFITPTMRVAWSQGLPYAIVHPDGKREIAPGSPFGGGDAPSRRTQVVEMVLDDLGTLPGEITAQLWDERSLAEPRFHRVDPKSYDALLTHFASRPTRSFWGFRKGDATSHCASTLLLPCEFKDPIAMVSPFKRTAGAASRALKELGASRYPPEVAPAAETLRHALTDALELRLPLIVDW